MPFSRIVTFGDSLSDTGEIFRLSSDTLIVPYPPSFFGYAGVFSNGPVYADLLPGLLGGEGASYAVGGAEAVGSATFSDFLVGLDPRLITNPTSPSLDVGINLDAQLDRGLAAETGDLSDAAAAFFIGANDYANFVPSLRDPTGAGLVTDVIEAQISAGRAAAEAGFGTLIYYTLPVAAFFPAFAAVPPALQGLAETLNEANNTGLIDGATALDAELSETEVEIVDITYLSEELLADPTAYGFVAPLDRSVVDLTGPFPEIVDDALLAAFDEDQILFWDDVHPTAATHGIFAAYSVASLTTILTEGTEAGDGVIGGAEVETVFGAGGDDTISTRGGADVVLAGLGADVISGGEGDDLLNGGSGDDDLRGGLGNDVLAGAAGDDFLRGGLGDDVLIDGLGSDVALGGPGDDVFLFTEASLIGGASGVDTDVFSGGAGDDILYIAVNGPPPDVPLGSDFTIAELGLTAQSIETVVFVDGRTDLATVETAADLETADLWGFV
ncbi:MAG: SGNH/GDSL hydrolase family protein [Pseudomonadota bacterium]